MQKSARAASSGSTNNNAMDQLEKEYQSQLAKSAQELSAAQKKLEATEKELRAAKVRQFCAPDFSLTIRTMLVS